MGSSHLFVSKSRFDCPLYAHSNYGCVTMQHHCEVIEIVKPFELVYKLMSTKFKHIESISYGSPFILMTELSCTSPWKLFVVESNFEPVSYLFI